MKIIQLSDWHVGEDMLESKEISQGLIDNVLSSINSGDTVAVCICGDIIDKGSIGNADRKYANAKEILENVKQKISKRNCNYKFFCVPGNHDIVTTRRIFKRTNSNPFELFCKFAFEVTNEIKYKEFLKQPLISFEFFGINWVLCNSSSRGDIRFGEVDIAKLKNAISTSSYPSVVLTHHTLFSDGSTDSSVLRNGYQMLDAIKDNTLAVLHGHTHGFKNIKIGDKCLLVGVGPFLKDVPDINKQLNLIEIGSLGINTISNYFWRKDIQMPPKLIYKRKSSEYFSNDMNTLISQIRHDVREQSDLHNITIRYVSSLGQMRSQIVTSFPNELEAAEKWQQHDCPDGLYFNHGERIYRNNSREYIRNRLRTNPTCRRAIITLIDQNEIQKSGDSYLPSFDTVQFSFTDEDQRDFSISLYMRALEVEYFLPINLCELYLLVQYLRDENIPIDSINIAIFAHRMVAIKDFDGFKKALIDQISEEDLTTLLLNGDYSKIANMLQEKRDGKETIYHTHGIKLLKTCILKNTSHNSKRYEKTIWLIDNLLSIVDDLTNARTKHSNGVNEVPLKKSYDDLINDLLLKSKKR